MNAPEFDEYRELLPQEMVRKGHYYLSKSSAHPEPVKFSLNEGLIKETCNWALFWFYTPIQ